MYIQYIHSQLIAAGDALRGKPITAGDYYGGNLIALRGKPTYHGGGLLRGKSIALRVKPITAGGPKTVEIISGPFAETVRM